MLHMCAYVIHNDTYLLMLPRLKVLSTNRMYKA